MKQIFTYTEPNAKGDIQVTPKGDVTIIQPNGEMEMELRSIKAVGITNLGDVIEHRITTIVGSRSHLVRFSNGGELQYAYNSLGQLIELTSRDLFIYISENHEIRFGIPGDQSIS